MTSPHAAHISSWEQKALATIARRQERELQQSQHGVAQGERRAVAAAYKTLVQTSNKRTCSVLVNAKREVNMEAVDTKVQRGKKRDNEVKTEKEQRQEAGFQAAINKRDSKRAAEKELKAAYNRIKLLESSLAEMTAVGAGAVQAFAPSSPPRFGGESSDLGSVTRSRKESLSIERQSPERSDAALLSVARTRVMADKPYSPPSRLKWR